MDPLNPDSSSDQIDPLAAAIALTIAGEEETRSLDPTQLRRLLQRVQIERQEKREAIQERRLDSLEREVRVLRNRLAAAERECGLARDHEALLYGERGRGAREPDGLVGEIARARWLSRVLLWLGGANGLGLVAWILTRLL